MVLDNCQHGEFDVPKLATDRIVGPQMYKGPLRFLLRPQDSKYFISNITLYPYSMNTSSLIKCSAYIPESERTTKNGILWAASENAQFWRGHNLKIGSDGPNLMKYSESLCPHYSRFLCSYWNSQSLRRY